MFYTIKKGVDIMKKCPVCGGNSPSASRRCDYCGTLFPQEFKDGGSSYYDDSNKGKNQNVPPISMDYTHQAHHNPSERQPTPAQNIFGNSHRAYVQPTAKKKNKFGCLVAIIIFAIIGFFALGIVGYFVSNVIEEAENSAIKEVILQDVGTETIEEIPEKYKVVGDSLLGNKQMFENEKFYIANPEASQYDYDNEVSKVESYFIYFDKDAVGSISNLDSAVDYISFGGEECSFSVRFQYDYQSREQIFYLGDSTKEFKRLKNLKINGYTVEVYYRETTYESFEYTYIIVPVNLSNSKTTQYASITCRGDTDKPINYKELIKHIEYNMRTE